MAGIIDRRSITADITDMIIPIAIAGHTFILTLVGMDTVIMDKGIVDAGSVFSNLMID